MKLNRLTLTNFQRMADLDIELHTSKIHLFAGRNEAGKSTIRDAIRFAVRGTSSRVELKKDYKRLVTKGGRKGIVQLEFDDQSLQRDVATGKAESDDALPEEAQIAADLAFGSQAFVDLKLEERLKFLYRLTGVRTDQEEITKRMKKREVADGLIDRLKSFYRTSIEAAHTNCEQELTRQRARWSQVAGGEAYGTKKAEDWAPQPPEKLDDDEVDVEFLDAQISTVDATVNDFNQQLGKANAQVQERTRLLASEERLDGYVRNLSTLQQDLASLRRDLDGGMFDGKTYVGVKDEIATMEELIANGERAQHVLTCPGCSAALILNADAELDFVDPEAVNFQKSDEELQELREKVRESNARVTQLQGEVDKVTRQIGAAEGSSKLKAEIHSKLLLLTKPEEIALVQQNLVESEKELHVLRAQRSRAVEYQNQVTANVESKKTALEIHKSILQWIVAKEALAPTGIQQELLTEALSKINDRMLKAARAVGWLAPKITPDMEVEREDGMTYGLLSESAQWRVGVIVADAISSMSGINLLVIDRMDVLDPPSRVPFMQWITKIAVDYDTILVMGTMKDRPVGLPKDIEVHWLENGELIKEKVSA